ncbi:NAD(P)-dependent oxidoreductase [Agrobacterium tumefaciens]|uniref:NAD(P)-dependent oxidoreductase n=1 Tax=Agrobacterium tumefaciens TaxID=358 RepID=A0A4D7YRN6_AGRTU|nr:NAD(P)-dependent oxidoreductase [Agrobacterium tumefaciens]
MENIAEDIVGYFANEVHLRSAFERADAVIHTAALHAPHVGVVPDAEFQRINVDGTRMVAQAAMAAGVPRLVFTSTTALYGHAVSAASCTFIDEGTPPRPKSIYHRTKLEAEQMLEAMAGPHLAVRVLRMSRSFPESADVMAAYRLHRGVDMRDVADAHVLALTNAGDDFQRYIISAPPPFSADDCDSLAKDAASVLRQRTPALADAFTQREWALPATIDRIYSPACAAEGLGWTSRFGFGEVLAQLDRRSLEVLPVGANISRKSE